MSTPLSPVHLLSHGQKAKSYIPQSPLAVKSRYNGGFFHEMSSREIRKWKGEVPSSPGLALVDAHDHHMGACAVTREPGLGMRFEALEQLGCEHALLQLLNWSWQLQEKLWCLEVAPVSSSCLSSCNFEISRVVTCSLCLFPNPHGAAVHYYTWMFTDYTWPKSLTCLWAVKKHSLRSLFLSLLQAASFLII